MIIDKMTQIIISLTIIFVLCAVGYMLFINLITILQAIVILVIFFIMIGFVGKLIKG
jgi:hypothetical protein